MACYNLQIAAQKLSDVKPMVINQLRNFAMFRYKVQGDRRVAFCKGHEHADRMGARTSAEPSWLHLPWGPGGRREGATAGVLGALVKHTEHQEAPILIDDTMIMLRIGQNVLPYHWPKTKFSALSEVT